MPNVKPSSTLSAGAIAGIVSALVALIAGIGVLIFFIVRKKKKEKARKKQTERRRKRQKKNPQPGPTQMNNKIQTESYHTWTGLSSRKITQSMESLNLKPTPSSNTVTPIQTPIDCSERDITVIPPKIEPPAAPKKELTPKKKFETIEFDSSRKDPSSVSYIEVISKSNSEKE